MSHRQRLDLVVCDVDRGCAESRLKRGDVRTRLDTQLGVKVRQRLIHQEDTRLSHDGPAHCYALPLAARERSGSAAEVLFEVEHRCGVVHLLLPLLLLYAPQLQGKAHVFCD